MNWPTYRPYFPVLVRLLQGVIYAEEEKYRSLLLNYRKDIETFFLQIGLLLVIVEHEEFAYLTSINREEAPDGFKDLPKLTRRRQLSFPITLICILLKKHYTQHQENVGSFEPPTIAIDELFEAYQSIPSVTRNDEWRGRQHFETQLNKVKNELRVVRESGLEDGRFRILPSINSLVTIEFLEQYENLTAGQNAALAEQEIELE